MVAKRIIPCLDVKDGAVVKGINFEGLKEVGDAVEMGVRYSAQGADELVYLDISASFEGRRTFAELVGKIARGINIPFTVGGSPSTAPPSQTHRSSAASPASTAASSWWSPSTPSRLTGAGYAPPTAEGS